jgi:anti-sigma B factor antagonist
MFKVLIEPAGAVTFTGRLDTTQAPRALELMQPLSGTVTINLAELEYISSAGLGVLIATHNRLKASGGALILLHPTQHVRHILSLACLDKVLTIQ